MQTWRCLYSQTIRYLISHQENKCCFKSKTFSSEVTEAVCKERAGKRQFTLTTEVDLGVPDTSEIGVKILLSTWFTAVCDWLVLGRNNDLIHQMLAGHARRSARVFGNVRDCLWLFEAVRKKMQKLVRRLQIVSRSMTMPCRSRLSSYWFFLVYRIHNQPKTVIMNNKHEPDIYLVMVFWRRGASIV